MRRRVRRTVILVAAVLAVIGITAFYGYYWVVSDFADMPAGVAPSPPGQIVPPPTATLPAPTLPPPTAQLPKPKPPPKGNGGGPETGKGGTETGNGGTALTPPSPTPTLPSPGLPDYPWPPEEPSSLVRIDSLYPDDWHERSLFEVAELLTAALQEAAYLELGFYAAPGGFVMVTRLEGTDAAGAPLAAERRYQLSDDRSDFSFREYVLSLFFAPKGYYRFIAFVVSDVPYTTRDEPLEETEGAGATPSRRGRLAQRICGPAFLPLPPGRRADLRVPKRRARWRCRDAAPRSAPAQHPPRELGDIA